MAKRGRRKRKLELVRAVAEAPKFLEASGATVAAMKDVVAAGTRVVEAAQSANAMALNALAVECAAREGVDTNQFVFNITTFRWEAKAKV